MRLFQAALDTCLGSPSSATLSVHGLHFMVYAPSRNPKWKLSSRPLADHEHLLLIFRGAAGLEDRDLRELLLYTKSQVGQTSFYKTLLFPAFFCGFFAYSWKLPAYSGAFFTYS